MTEERSFTEKYSFSLSVIITSLFLIIPGFLEAVVPALEKFQKGNGVATFIIWFNLWCVSIIFVFNKQLSVFVKKDRLIKRTLQSIASLKFTVFLLTVSLILVFVGTLAQTTGGIWEVVDAYFRCLFSRVDVNIFLPGAWGESEAIKRLHFFFPGGFTIGACLLLNLLAAHGLKFKISAKGSNLAMGTLITIAGLAFIGYIVYDGIWREDIPSAYVDSYKRVLYRLLSALGSTTVLMIGSWFLFKKRAGVVVLHFGIILLLVAELVTAFYATEGNMTIAEGQTISFVDISREFELAISDPSVTGDSEKSITIPENFLRETGVWHKPEGSPVEFKVLEWFNNADLDELPVKDMSFNGLGQEYKLTAVRESTGVEDARMSMPGIIVQFRKNDKDLGKYALAQAFYLARKSELAQSIKIDDKEYNLMFRNRREYLYSRDSKTPVRVSLIDFRHDTYMGTSVAKNFSSLISLKDDEKGIDRKVLISMNNPLRYTGRTFYQQSFAQDESGTVLQVVRNPGWMLPYLCCVIVGVGLLFQFILTLIKFTGRKAA
jgi:hypothetical protein